MDFKLEALFSIDNPTPDKLAEAKKRVTDALSAIGRDVQVSVDFGVTEFLRQINS